MIVQEHLEGMIRTYSDAGLRILQEQTGIVYDEAIDVEPCAYSYTEATDKLSVGYTEDALMEMSNVELTEILARMGISTTMNKANMVRLILAAGSEP